MSQEISCVLLADQHHGLRDSVRGLLETEFATVFMVANEASLLEGAGQLKPDVVVLDLSLSAGDMRGLVGRVRERAPNAKILALSVHDEQIVADAVMAAGSDAVVLKRSLVTDLMPAVDALLAGKRFVSPGISQEQGTVKKPSLKQDLIALALVGLALSLVETTASAQEIAIEGTELGAEQSVRPETLPSSD